jgi:hydrogenase expression/formation protein HypC
MCLAVPLRIESIEGEQATAWLAQTKATVMITLVPEAKVGDWVLVHAGYAIAVVDEQQARQTFALLREMDLLGEP